MHKYGLDPEVVLAVKMHGQLAFSVDEVKNSK
jgi:hypothetical protein